MTVDEQQQVDGNNNATVCEDGRARRRRLVMIGAAVVVLLILVPVLSQPSCKTVDEPPIFPKHISQPIPAQNNKALVRFSGYLRLELEDQGDFDETKYLELQLLGVHHSVEPDYGIRILLDTDCATIDIVLRRSYPDFSFETSMIYIRSKSSSLKFDQCQTRAKDIKFLFDHYYRCRRSLFYRCIDLSGPKEADGKRLKQVGLQIDVLDLEIGSDSVSVDSIASGRFNFPPKDC